MSPGPAEDLERLAVAAYLVGHDDESARAWEQAHARWVEAGDPDRAARCAFWLGFGLLLRGETAQANGWLARAARLIDAAGVECVTRGYLQVVACLIAINDGDAESADAGAREMIEVAGRFGDRDLLALGLLCGGEAALALGETARGATLFDEAMVAVTTGEVSPIAAGIVYCGVIDSCMGSFDLRRAAEWTDALDRWCAAQPDRSRLPGSGRPRGRRPRARRRPRHLRAARRRARPGGSGEPDQLGRPR